MSGRRGRAALEGAGAALAAVGVMAGLCAFGLEQLGAEGVPAMTAAAVTLAVGGSVDLAASGSGRASGLGAGLHGTAHLMPLGVSLTGAAVLVLVFWAPLRRRTPAVAELATRACAAAATFLGSVAVLALLSRGRLPLADLGLRDRGDRGQLPPGLGDRLDDRLDDRLGDRLGDRLEGRPGGGGSTGDATFSADMVTALGAGLLWVLVVLAVGWLVSGRGPLPASWAWADRLRPAVSSTVVVLVALAASATAAGLALGLVGRDGTLAGGVLFGGGTGVLAALTLGIGAPWSMTSSGSMTTLLPPDRLPDGLLGGGSRTVLTAVAFAAVTLLVSAVLAARRDRDTGEDNRARRAVAAGVRHGLVVAVVLSVLTLLAGASVEFGVSLLGSELMGAELGLGGNVALTLVLGAGAGAVTGAAGHLAVDLVRRARRRPAPSIVDS
jgi:hypothetical protein